MNTEYGYYAFLNLTGKREFHMAVGKSLEPRCLDNVAPIEGTNKAWSALAPLGPDC